MANTHTKDKEQQRFGTESHMDKAKDAAGEALDKAKDAAKEAATSVGQMVDKATEKIGEKADDAAAYVGGGIKSMGENIREKGPQEGILGGAASGVASAMEQTGKYLEKEGLTGMTEDVTELIKRNPVAAVLVGVAVGYLLGRALSRS